MLLRKPAVVYENPSLEEAVKAVKKATSGRKTVIVVGSCKVEYQGRASSKLGAGERILVVKEDGSVMVHRQRGNEPVNWQPPGSVFYTSSRKGILTVKAARKKPNESITAHFDRVFLVAVLSLVDRAEFAMYASEEDMQKAVLMQPSIVEEGLKPITYEKKVKPGFIDVYAVDAEGRMAIVEIKRKTAGKEAALQLSRYVDSVRGIVNREVRGILAAPSIAKGVQKLLVTLGLDFRQLDPKKCAEIVKEIETRKLEDFFP